MVRMSRLIKVIRSHHEIIAEKITEHVEAHS
jgi:hypothetical protein